GLFDQAGAADPPGLLADSRHWAGPAKPHLADLRDMKLAPATVHPSYCKRAALRHVDGHPGSDSALEPRRAASAGVEGLPRLHVALEDLLRGLGGQLGQPRDLIPGLTNRVVGLPPCRPPAAATPLPPLMQKIPQRPRRMTLDIESLRLPGRQAEPSHATAP